MELPSAKNRDGDAPNAARSAAGFGTRLIALGQLPPFTPRQQRVFLIALTAGFFDQYDRALLSLALKQIQTALRIAESSLGAMLSLIRLGFALSLLVTPLADVFGRRRLLLYTIVGYTVFTAISAIAPGDRSFVASQVIARAFAGAEATIALVILVEEVDANNRGWAVGMLAAVASCGDALAAVAFMVINEIPYGWRGLYAIALVPLALLIPLRRILPESHRFEAQELAHAAPPAIWDPMRRLFRAHPGRLAMMLMVAFLAAAGGNTAGLFLSKFLQEVHGYSPSKVSLLFLAGGGLGIAGNVFAGRLSDQLGRRSMGALFNLLAPLVTIMAYSTTGFSVVAAVPLAMFAYTAGATILAAYSTELFPTSYRSTAGAALMVAGTIGGATGLLLETVLYHFTHSHWTSVRYLEVIWMLAPAIMMFLPETAGRELEDISPETV